MAVLIRDHRIASDSWQHTPDDQALPPGDVIVSFERWESERTWLLRRSGGLGLRVSGDVSVEEIAGDLSFFDLIALEFRAFTDGRCYSHARLLRERFGFRGEIRAVGEVLRDQLYFLARCGVNAFEVGDEEHPEEWLKAFNEFSVQYQAAADDAGPLYRRHRRA